MSYTKTDKVVLALQEILESKNGEIPEERFWELFSAPSRSQRFKLYKDLFQFKDERRPIFYKYKSGKKGWVKLSGSLMEFLSDSMKSHEGNGIPEDMWNKMINDSAMGSDCTIVDFDDETVEQVKTPLVIPEKGNSEKDN